MLGRELMLEQEHRTRELPAVPEPALEPMPEQKLELALKLRKGQAKIKNQVLGRGRGAQTLMLELRWQQ
jgi:hypothetical protein